MTRRSQGPGRVGLGAATAAAQVVINAGVLFLLYPFVKDTVGPERFGVWALVVGTTLSVNVAEFGLSGAALRFVAHALGRDDAPAAARIAETAVLSALGLMGLVALAFYGPLAAGLDYLLREAAGPLREEARRLLPWTLTVVSLTGAGASALGALDGAQRVHVRSALVVAGSLVLGAAAVVLVPRYGLVGFVGAQALQACFLLAGAWIGLRRTLPGLTCVPLRWRRAAFRQLVGYGMRWQAITTLMVLTDPVAKALATQFGGVAFVGTYEFASKLALQCRNVLAAMQTALLPHLTRLHAHAADALPAFYALSLRATLAVAVLALPAALAISPWLDAYWDGPVSLLLVLLLPAWGFNLLSNPAYNELAARGTLGPNVASHLVLSLLNAGLGWGLGTLLGGPGVALGFAVALTTGSLVTVALYRRRFRAPVGADRYDLLALLVGGIGGGGLYLLARLGAARPHPGLWLIATGIGLMLYAALALGVLARHPVRAGLLRALRMPESPEPA